MSELPIGWATASLGDLCEIARGGSPRPIKDYLTSDPNGINWVKIGDATASTKYIFETREKIRPEGLKKSRLVKNGDFLLSNSMSFGRPYIMRTTGCIHDGWLVLRDRVGTFDQDYLYHFLGSPYAYQQFDRLAAGTTVRNLNSDLVKDVEVLLPPLAEQRRIVAKLDTLTVRIARARVELDRVPVLAQHLRSSALAALCREVSSAESVPVSRLAITTFDGPFGSNLKSVDYVPSGVRVIRLENIGHLRFIADKETFISIEKYEALTRHTLKPDDILFSSFVDREVRVCRFPGGDVAAINKADCFAVRINPMICDVRFATYMLASPNTYEAMKANVHGATRPRIGLSQLRDYALHLPSLAEQVAIADQLDVAFARADRLEAEAARARTLLDRLESSILAKAFRGELAPQDKNDEPAGALLERIRGQRALTPRQTRVRRRPAANG